jgi:hypothetical protein
MSHFLERLTYLSRRREPFAEQAPLHRLRAAGKFEARRWQRRLSERGAVAAHPLGRVYS